MKRTLWIFCVFILVLSFHIPLGFTDEFFARAIAVEGSAQVQKGGSGSWQEMQDGMALGRGDVLRTMEDSRVDVSFDKKLDNVMRIAEKSLATLSSQQEVLLPKGKILAKLDNLKTGTSFNVGTPVAICGVRGSAFGVQTDGSITDGYAFEDSTYVTGLDAAGNPIGSELVVQQGMETSVQIGSVPSVPTIMAQSEMEEYKEFAKEIQELQSLVSEQKNNSIVSISPSGSR